MKRVVECEPDRACSPYCGLDNEGVYSIFCNVCNAKWKWQLDEEGLKELRKKYGAE